MKNYFLLSVLTILFGSCMTENMEIDQALKTTHFDPTFQVPIGTTYEVKDNQVEYTLPEGYDVVSNIETEQIATRKGGPATTITVMCFCKAGYDYGYCDIGISNTGTPFCLTQNECTACEKVFTVSYSLKSGREESIKAVQANHEIIFVRKTGSNDIKSNAKPILDYATWNSLDWPSQSMIDEIKVKEVLEGLNKDYGVSNNSTDKPAAIVHIPIEIYGYKYLVKSSLDKWNESDQTFMYIIGNPRKVTCKCIHPDGECIKQILSNAVICETSECQNTCQLIAKF